MTCNSKHPPFKTFIVKQITVFIVFCKFRGVLNFITRPNIVSYYSNILFVKRFH